MSPPVRYSRRQALLFASGADTLTQEIFEWNEIIKTGSKARLIRVGQHARHARRQASRQAGWVYAEEYDGDRVLAYQEGARVQLRSRNGKDRTLSFPKNASVIQELPHATLLLDGEVVVFDSKRISHFQRLRHGNGEPVYAVFDCLFAHVRTCGMNRSRHAARSLRLCSLPPRRPVTSYLHFVRPFSASSRCRRREQPARLRGLLQLNQAWLCSTGIRTRPGNAAMSRTAKDRASSRIADKGGWLFKVWLQRSAG
jgi:ATP dependent DNA ligase domain